MCTYVRVYLLPPFVFSASLAFSAIIINILLRASRMRIVSGIPLRYLSYVELHLRLHLFFFFPPFLPFLFSVSSIRFVVRVCLQFRLVSEIFIIDIFADYYYLSNTLAIGVSRASEGRTEERLASCGDIYETITIIIFI